MCCCGVMILKHLHEQLWFQRPGSIYIYSVGFKCWGHLHVHLWFEGHGAFISAVVVSKFL
jgi:hypothetical protein